MEWKAPGSENLVFSRKGCVLEPVLVKTALWWPWCEMKPLLPAAKDLKERHVSTSQLIINLPFVSSRSCLFFYM